MKIRTLLTLTFVVVGTVANAQYYYIDQIRNVASTNDADVFGSSQIIGDSPTFSSMVLADVDFTTGILQDVYAGFGFSRAAALGLVTGWRVSVFRTPEDAFAGDVGFQSNVVTTFDVSASNAVYSSLSGSGSGSTPTLVSLEHVNQSVELGRHWVGVAAILNGGNYFEQAFVLRNSNPFILRTNIPNTDVCVQPGDGFGFGGPVKIDTTASNAAYAFTSPEPTTMIALGLGVAALLRKRRTS